MALRHSLLHSLAITVPALTACAGSFPAPDTRSSPDATAVTIEVENLNWWDIEVQLNTEGGRYRLGVAPSYQRTRFHVSSAKLSHTTYFRLVANPLNTGRVRPHVPGGRGSIATSEIKLSQGLILHWTVGPSDVATVLVVKR